MQKYLKRNSRKTMTTQPNKLTWICNQQVLREAFPRDQATTYVSVLNHFHDHTKIDAMRVFLQRTAVHYAQLFARSDIHPHLKEIFYVYLSFKLANLFEPQFCIPELTLSTWTKLKHRRVDLYLEVIFNRKNLSIFELVVALCLLYQTDVFITKACHELKLAARLDMLRTLGDDAPQCLLKNTDVFVSANTFSIVLSAKFARVRSTEAFMQYMGLLMRATHTQDDLVLACVNKLSNIVDLRRLNINTSMVHVDFADAALDKISVYHLSVVEPLITDLEPYVVVDFDVDCARAVEASGPVYLRRVSSAQLTRLRFQNGLSAPASPFTVNVQHDGSHYLLAYKFNDRCIKKFVFLNFSLANKFAVSLNSHMLLFFNQGRIFRLNLVQNRLLCVLTLGVDEHFCQFHPPREVVVRAGESYRTLKSASISVSNTLNYKQNQFPLKNPRHAFLIDFLKQLTPAEDASINYADFMEDSSESLVFFPQATHYGTVFCNKFFMNRSFLALIK